MRFPNKRTALTVLAMGLVASAAGAAAVDYSRQIVERYTPLTAYTLVDPAPTATSDGKVHLPYELIVTNSLAQNVRLTKLEIIDQSGKVAASMDENELIQRMSSICSFDLSTKPEDREELCGIDPQNVFRPSEQKIVLVDVILDPWNRVPTRLTHRLTFVPTKATMLVTSPMSETVARVLVSKDRSIVIGPPLRGGGWLNANGCCTERTAHRSSALPFAGGLYLSERYAIDFIQLTGGRFVHAIQSCCRATSTKAPICSPSPRVWWFRSPATSLKRPRALRRKGWRSRRTAAIT